MCHALTVKTEKKDTEEKRYRKKRKTERKDTGYEIF